MKKLILLVVLIGMLSSVGGCNKDFFRPNGSIQARKDQIRRLEYTMKHPELMRETRELILKGLLAPRFTREEVKASWGMPDEVYTDMNLSGSDELWVYHTTSIYYRCVPNYWLFFKKGRLVDCRK